MNPFFESTRPSHDYSLNYQPQQTQSHRSNNSSHRSHEYNNHNNSANSSHRAARDSHGTSDYYGSPTTTKRSLSSHRDYPMSHRSQSTSRMVQRNEQQQHPKHQRSKSTSRLRDFVHPGQEQTMTTNANSTSTIIKPKKNFIADNMLTLGFQLSHPMGYEFDKSLQGISRKINSRTVVPSSLTASLDRFRYNSDSQLNGDDQTQQNKSTTSGYSSSRTGRSRPLSASSSIQRIKYRQTGRHSDIIEYCQKNVTSPQCKTIDRKKNSSPILDTNGTVEEKPRSGRATPEPPYDIRKTKEMAKTKVAGLIPSNGSQLFEQSSITRAMKESYLPKKRGVQFPSPGPHSVVMAVHSTRYRITEPRLSTSKIPFYPDNR